MERKGRIDFLDGMRGLAIFTVIIYHYFAQIHGVARSDYYEAHPLIHYLYLSVPLFFVISGYVIFLTLDRTKDFTSFIVRRWIRLFPAMLIASIVIPLVALAFPYRLGGVPSLVDLLPGLTLLGANVISALVGVETDGLEGSFWTVYVEVRFYLMFGVLYFVLGKQRAFYSLLSLSLLLLVLIKVAPMVAGSDALALQSVFGKMLIGYHLPWFLVGMYIYLYDLREQRWLAALIAANALAYNADGAGEMIATGLLLLLIYGAFTTTAVQAFFRSRFLMFMGFISYPLYLCHDSIGRGIVQALQANFSRQLPFELFPPIAFVALVIPAWYIAKYLEPAIQRWLKRRLLPPTLPEAAVA